MAGQVYPQIIEERATFSSQMVVSGTATSTGKSLLQTVCMNIFHGKVMPTTTSITESSFYQQLEEEDIFVREFTTKKSNKNSGGVDPKVGNPFNISSKSKVNS